MKIKFKKPDPRAGLIAELSDQALIDRFVSDGSAVLYDEKADSENVPAETEPSEVTREESAPAEKSTTTKKPRAAK